MTQTTIKGLLIEGVDYSGKTSVANEVARVINDGGRKVARRNCFVNKHPIIERLVALASGSDGMEARDVIYTSALLLDLILPEPAADSEVLIQERHVLTQIGRNLFFYDDHQGWHIDDMRRLRRPFDRQVYLTSNIDTKRSRTRKRPAKSPRDALLASDPVLHQRYDEAMLQLLPKNEDWLVIDTSTLEVKEIASRIVEYFQQDRR